MCILNATIKQLKAAQQPATRHKLPATYTNIIKRGLAIIKKLVFKQINYKIIVIYYKYLSLKSKKVKPAKIVKAVNSKLREKVKSKIIIVKELSSRDIVLITNLVDVKNHLLKKIS